MKDWVRPKTDRGIERFSWLVSAIVHSRGWWGSLVPIGSRPHGSPRPTATDGPRQHHPADESSCQSLSYEYQSHHCCRRQREGNCLLAAERKKRWMSQASCVCAWERDSVLTSCDMKNFDLCSAARISFSLLNIGPYRGQRWEGQSYTVCFYGATQKSEAR